MKRINVEEKAVEFEKHFKIASISRCDWLEIYDDKLVFIEETVYIDTPDYIKETRSIVKKMAGSFAIAVWLAERENDPEILSKRRFFVVEVTLTEDTKAARARFARVLRAMLNYMEKHKNGFYNEVSFTPSR